ncbi:MAG: hypothetical protein J3K34DRAFT_468373 [Monoraphidium minutum]|nr:MAG: hypothetical protein J3K34DRAFT_468373 [Monoraphidium minutum]
MMRLRTDIALLQPGPGGTVVHVVELKYYMDEDALHQRLDSDAARRWRYQFIDQTRREMRRRLWARRNAALLRDLRGSLARSWTGYKSDGRVAPGGAFTLEEIGAHWVGVLGSESRGALEERPAGSPADMAAALGAAAERAGLDPARRAAAATLGAPTRQAGFHDDRWAADPVLRHLIERARLSPERPRRRLFAAFIDLEKAYDSVSHTQLEAWLAERASTLGAPLPGWGLLRAALLYADGIVLLAASAADLQSLLGHLHAFCKGTACS